jgi:hypothetical protein
MRLKNDSPPLTSCVLDLGDYGRKNPTLLWGKKSSFGMGKLLSCSSDFASAKAVESLF